jgi:signal peptidase I
MGQSRGHYMIYRWLFSKTVREACVLRKHVRRWMSAQRDLLSPQAIGAVTLAMIELKTAIHEGANTGKIRIKMEELEFTANKWLKPYPHAIWRENVEVLLVAIAVAMSLRTFFPLQPFKIPTGSMQPTLYGITSQNLLGNPSYKIPTGWERVKEWFEGVSYVHVVAETDGAIDRIDPMKRFLIFNIEQTLWIDNVPHTIWFPPDFGEAPPGEDPLIFRAGLRGGHIYHKGEDVVNLRVCAGDHLFVDRFTYNFRQPKRGEIVVFETAGISGLPQDQFYIKRLVGLGGETLSIKQDYEVGDVPRFGAVPVGHLVANGQPLSASTPHFENLYAFAGVRPGERTLKYQENHYYGHAMLEALAPGSSFQVQPNHLFVMGDNTFNSSDSRYWGNFQSDHTIGKSSFVYWPITKRFGWGNQ